MTDITIPERFLPGFKLIATLQSSDLNILIDVLSKMPIGEKPKFDFTEHENLSLSEKDINLLIGTVLSVVSLWQTRKGEQNTLVSLLADAYILQVNEDFENHNSDEQKDKLANNLT